MATASIVWLNGDWTPLHDARISPLDRGFLFGDAVYEVIPVIGATPLLEEAHLGRLAASLRAARITNPYSKAEWQQIVAGLIDRNGGTTVAVYLQVSRGADTTRARTISAGLVPTVFGLSLSLGTSSTPVQEGCSAILLNDPIKSLQVLGMIFIIAGIVVPNLRRMSRT